MNPKDLRQSIIKKIESENIQPRSRYYFWLKNFLFWMALFWALILGAISVAVIWFQLMHLGVGTDPLLFRRIYDLLQILPLLWIIAILGATLLGIWAIKNTQKGYRIPLWGILLGNILGSILLGSGVYALGGGALIEEKMEAKMPFYQGARSKHEKFWGQPRSSGRLAGEIMETISDKSFQLQGPRQELWEVKVRESFDRPMPPKGAFVRMRGKIVAPKVFEAEMLRHDPRGKRLQRPPRSDFKFR